MYNIIDKFLFAVFVVVAYIVIKTCFYPYLDKKFKDEKYTVSYKVETERTILTRNHDDLDNKDYAIPVTQRLFFIVLSNGITIQCDKNTYDATSPEDTYIVNEKIQ